MAALEPPDAVAEAPAEEVEDPRAEDPRAEEPERVAQKHRALRPLQDPLTAKEAAALRKRAKERREIARKVTEAGACASRQMSEQSNGLMTRSSLFNSDDWKESHASRQKSMEGTFRTLYTPSGSSYWRQPQPQRVARPLGASAYSGPGVPPWASELPHALSLAHPAFREGLDDLSGADPAEVR